MSEDPALESPLSVERVDGDAQPRIVVRGEMDAFTAGDVRTAVIDGTDAGVDLDLRGVTFMDSSGLGTLIVIHQVMEASGRRLVITGRSPIVQRLFELSGVTTRFHLGHE